jgi:hypothetical protein
MSQGVVCDLSQWLTAIARRSLDWRHHAQFLGEHALIHAEMQVDFLLTYRRHDDVHLLRQQAEHQRDSRFQLRRTNAVFHQGSADGDIVGLFLLEDDLDQPRPRTHVVVDCQPHDLRHATHRFSREASA